MDRPEGEVALTPKLAGVRRPLSFQGCVRGALCGAVWGNRQNRLESRANAGGLAEAVTFTLRGVGQRYT